jgi:hypothetical protein
MRKHDRFISFPKNVYIISLDHVHSILLKMRPKSFSPIGMANKVLLADQALTRWLYEIQ